MRRSGTISIYATLLVLGVLCVLFVLLLLPTRRTAYETPRRKNCISNLKLITVGLHNYQTANGAFPPAYTVDAEGNRLHSWRTLILPHIGHAMLFAAIDLTKPWDDPANAKARKAVVDAYQCPIAEPADGLTTYLGVFGPDCAFSGPVPRTVSEVKDGLSYTVMVVDVPSSDAVHWMSPFDVSEEEVLSYGPDSEPHHPGVINAALMDGSVISSLLEWGQEKLRAMLTVSGGELVDK